MSAQRDSQTIEHDTAAATVVRQLTKFWGTSRQVERAAHAVGATVSRTTIRKWGNAGHIEARAKSDGSIEYSLDEVISYWQLWQAKLQRLKEQAD